MSFNGGYDPAHSVLFEYDALDDQRIPIYGGSEEIQVFDDTANVIDLHAVADDERESILSQAFPNNPGSITTFTDLIRDAAYLRTTFKTHPNKDIMLRQIVGIAQDPKLFCARMVIPTIQFHSNETFLDVLKRSNPPPSNANVIIRRIISKVKDADAHNKKVVSNAEAGLAVQFKDFTLADCGTYIALVAPTDSVYIKKLRLVPSACSFDGIGEYYSLSCDNRANFCAFYDARPFDVRALMEQIGADPMELYNALRMIYLNRAAARPLDVALPSGNDASALQVSSIVVANKVAPEIIALSNALKYTITMDATYSTNIPAVFMAQGLTRLYTLALYAPNGLESEIARVIIDEERASHMRKNVDATAQRERFRIVSRLQLIAQIAQEFFAGQFDDILRDARYLRTEADLLDRFPKKERQFIERKLDDVVRKREAHIKLDAVASQCGHNAAIANLLRAVSITSIRAALNDVAPFVGDLGDPRAKKEEPAQGSLIKCRACKTPDIICPHVLILANATVSRLTMHEVRELSWTFARSIRDKGIQYCNICGEVFQVSMSDDDLEHTVERDPELTSDIYHEVNMILRIVRLTRVLDIMRFRTSIIDRIYPHIDAFTRKSFVSKAGAISEVAARIKLRIAIFTFAAIIHELDTAGVIFEDDRSGMATTQAGALKYAQKKIISMENVTISSIQGMTGDLVLEALIAAYKLLKTDGYIVETQRVSDYRSPISYEPYYEMFVRNIEWPATPFGHEISAFKYLPPKPANPMHVYAPVIELYNKQKDPQARKIIISNIIKILSNRLFAYPISADIDAKVVRMRNEIMEDNAKLIAQERLVRFAVLDYKHVPMASRSIALKDSILFKEREYAIAYAFDENGNAHKWDVFVVRGDDGANIEVKAKSADVVDAGGILRKTIDRKCSTCGIMYSHVKKVLDEAKVRDKIAERSVKDNLFRFFESRCPNGGAHKYDVSNGTHVCSNCGFTPSMMQTLDNDYYEKFASTFNEIISSGEKTIAATSNTIYPSREIYEYINKRAKELAIRPWVYNFDAILSASAELGIDRNFIQTLGSKEGATKVSIIDGSFISPVPKSKYDTRIGTLTNYVLSIISNYCVIISGGVRASRANLQFMEAVFKRIDGAVNDSSVRANIVKNLPPVSRLAEVVLNVDGALNIDDKFAAEMITSYLQAFFDAHKPMEIIEQRTQAFCTMLMTILAGKNQISTAFVQETIAHITAMENITLQAEHFSINVVIGTRLYRQGMGTEGDEREGADGDVIDDDDDKSDPAFKAPTDEDEHIDNSAGAADALKLDDFDVDVDDADAEQDEGAVNLHIGDELGW